MSARLEETLQPYLGLVFLGIIYCKANFSSMCHH